MHTYIRFSCVWLAAAVNIVLRMLDINATFDTNIVAWFELGRELSASLARQRSDENQTIPGLR